MSVRLAGLGSNYALPRARNVSAAKSMGCGNTSQSNRVPKSSLGNVNRRSPRLFFRRSPSASMSMGFLNCRQCFLADSRASGHVQSGGREEPVGSAIRHKALPVFELPSSNPVATLVKVSLLRRHLGASHSKNVFTRIVGLGKQRRNSVPRAFNARSHRVAP
jgi:hypothetical protein